MWEIKDPVPILLEGEGRVCRKITIDPVTVLLGTTEGEEGEHRKFNIDPVLQHNRGRGKGG